MARLLPVGSSVVETCLAEMVADRHAAIAEKTQDIVYLWNPYKCPKHLLPWLAWSLNIEIWDTDWSESVQRKIIAEYFAIRSIRGTKEAILRAYELIGVERDLVELKEWHEDEGAGIPIFHFTVKIKGFASYRQKEFLRRVTDQLKPLRSRYQFTLSSDATHKVRNVIHGRRVKTFVMDWNFSLNPS